MSKAKAENRPLPKRFFEQAGFDAVGEEYAITLDDKMLRTPLAKLLQTKSKKLAQLIADEWNAQKEFIDTDSMPLTRLLNIALDRVAPHRAALLADIDGYAQTDLLCYRAPLSASALPVSLPNEELRLLQRQHFDPILSWIEKEYAAAFVLTDGLMPVLQPKQSLQKIAAVFAAANDHELAALALMVPILGSAFLTLALWKGFVAADDALLASRLDETVQASAYGEDAEVTSGWAAKARDVKAAEIFVKECA